MIPTCHMHPALPAFSRLVYGAWRLADDATATPQTVLRNIEICLDQGITTLTMLTFMAATAAKLFSALRSNYGQP